MRMVVLVLIMMVATSALADASNVFVSETEATTAIDIAPWRIYIDSGATEALDRDGDGEPDGYTQQHLADQAAKNYLRSNGGGEAFTGVGGVAMFRHTVEGRVVVIGEGGDDEPGFDLPLDMIAIYVDAEGGPSVGADTNDGLTELTAVATHRRAKVIAGSILAANPKASIGFLFRRGDRFPSFGRLEAGRIVFRGTAERYLLFAAYGEGPRPVFRGDPEAENHRDRSAFRLWSGNSYIEFRGIRVENGKFLDSLLGGAGLRLVDCVGRNAHITVAAPKDKRFVGVELIDCLIYDCVVPGGDGSAIWITRCDKVRVVDTVLYRNGWIGSGPDTPDDKLKGSVRNHGIYITGDCQVDAFDRNVCIFNAGAGAQVRPAGNTRGNFFAWNGRTGLDWGLVNGRSALDDKPGTGECSGNLIFTGFGTGLGVSDLDGAIIENNTIICAPKSLNKAMQIRADHGPNAFPEKGGQRFGINNTIVRGNRVRGRFHLHEAGWGVLPGAHGVTIEDNTFDRPIVVNDAARRSAKVKIRNNVTDANLSHIAVPQRTDELIERILSRELRAADLIRMFGGKQ